MKKYRGIGHQIIHILDSAVNVCIVAVLIFMFLSGLYILWDSNQVYAAASSVNYTVYRPDAEDQLSYEELTALNPDVCAWLTVYGTQIDYPVVQGEDNEKYLNTNAKGEYSLSGALFMDFENRSDFSDFNSIIFGHHMDQGAMFGEVDLFADQDFLDSHRYGSLYFNDTQYGLEIVSYLDADAYDTDIYGIVHAETDREEYLNNLLSHALTETDAVLSTDDRLVLLSTCSADSTNGRHILVTRISDEVMPNTYLQENSAIADTETERNSLPTSRSYDSLFCIGLPIIAIVLILLFLYRKNRKSA